MTSTDESCRAVDSKLLKWRQGDAALGETHIVRVVDSANPITPESAQLKDQSSETIQTIFVAVEGLVVVSQTCDILKPSKRNPFVQVSPLIKTNKENLKLVKQKRLIRYAHLPAFEKLELVIDLDQTMTIEKSVLAGWERTPGWRNDGEIKSFADALARKSSRFAFPDSFGEVMTVELLAYFKTQLKAGGDEGRLMRDITEIRVMAIPSWDSEKIELAFYFIMDNEAVREDIAPYFARWCDLLKSSGEYHHKKVNSRLVYLEDIKASEYLDSDQMDLEAMSPDMTYK